MSRAFVVLLLIAGARRAGADGRAIYAAHCAACHGGDGRGTPAREASAPVQPPDFTDCKFGTPEPNTDWLATVHEGGPARGFDRQMPAFGEVLTDGEIVAVVGYLRQFCREPSWPRGELNLARPFFLEKAFPEDELVVGVEGARSELTTTVFYERRLGARWQVELVAPVVYSEQMTGGWAGGVGDIAVSLKRVLFASLDSGSIASIAGEIATPTGRVDRGFGAGTTMFEGTLMAAQLLSHGVFLQVQAGVGIAYDRSYADEVLGRAALGDQIVPARFGRMVTPIVEMIATRELTDGAATELDVVPELQVTLSARQHIRALGGVSVPVTQRDGRDLTAVFYLLWDLADGGLLEGW